MILSEKARLICDENIQGEMETGCRLICPLAEPCKMQPGDNIEIFFESMNKAANQLNGGSNEE
jgi:hypothetical protein